ncbi:MAG TPA: DUF2461 domain-containing protein [Trebonia sp.]|nr:DUF2461 domain-containing protein [Trebonia sp.]
MTFSGWPEEALAFYEGLEDDNSKSYWTSHKAVYEASVLAPMTELIEELAAELERRQPGKVLGGEPRIFRPYRDIRFSADKTPYKTHIGATLGETSYVHLSADGLGAGAGMWQLGPERLARYRAAVAGPPGAELEPVVAAIEKAGHEVHGHGTLKTAPRGYPADHPRIGLLRHKGLTSWAHWTPGPWLATAEARERVLGLWTASAPLVEWLRANVD